MKIEKERKEIFGNDFNNAEDDIQFQIIHLGNPYDFVVKDHETDNTYGTFQGDRKQMQRMLKDFSKKIKELKGSRDSWKITASQEIAEKGGLVKQISELKMENMELKQQLKDCTKKTKEEIRKEKEEKAIRWVNIGR